MERAHVAFGSSWSEILPSGPYILRVGNSVHSEEREVRASWTRFEACAEELAKLRRQGYRLCRSGVAQVSVVLQYLPYLHYQEISVTISRMKCGFDDRPDVTNGCARMCGLVDNVVVVLQDVNPQMASMFIVCGGLRRGVRLSRPIHAESLRLDLQQRQGDAPRLS